MRDPLLFAVALTTTVYIVLYLVRAWPTGHLASPSSLYAALTAIHFAIPGLLLALEEGPSFVHYPNAQYAAEAMIFVLVGLVFIQFGSLAASSKLCLRKDGAHSFAVRVWSYPRVLIVFLVLLLVGWVTRIYIVESNAYFQIQRASQGELEGPFHAAIRMVELFPQYALCILAIVYWRPGKTPSRSLRFGLPMSVASELIYWIPSGRKEPVILAIALPLLIRYLRTGRRPSGKILGTLALSMTVLFPVTFMYRNAMETVGTNIELVDTVILAVDLASSDPDVVSVGKSSQLTFFERLNLLEAVSASIRMIRDGDWEPMHGESYAGALLAFVPRLLWSEKPDLHYGTAFGHEAGFLSSEDWLTSISVTYFGEAFLNFGWAGAFPLLLMGGLLGSLYRQTRMSVRHETWLLAYAVALPTVLYVGGTFALHFGGLAKLVPLFLLVGWAMECRRPIASSTLIMKTSSVQNHVRIRGIS
jgi:hypothetical protein